MGLAIGAKWKFYTSVAKGLKLKIRKFCGLIPTFAEVTKEKLVGWDFFAPPFLPPILNRAKMLVALSPIFVADTKITFAHNFVAPLVTSSAALLGKTACDTTP